MLTLYRFCKYLVIRSLIMSAIGWAAATYWAGDALRSPTALREQSLGALVAVGRVIGR